MFSKVVNNFKLIDPLPAFWWLGIGYIAQFFWPKTLLNSDNMSVTSFQAGVAISVLLALLSLFIASIFYENRPNESGFLRFIYSSSKQFAELAMAVFGFSSAYFFHNEDNLFASSLIFLSVLLATALNHIFLVVFNEKDTGTLKFALDLDKKFKKEWCSRSVKVVAGLVALGVFTFLGALILGCLKT